MDKSSKKLGFLIDFINLNNFEISFTVIKDGNKLKIIDASREIIILIKLLLKIV